MASLWQTVRVRSVVCISNKQYRKRIMEDSYAQSARVFVRLYTDLTASAPPPALAHIELVPRPQLQL